ncbi:MAG: PAS domain S-box protein, partial [Deltaproteobacteria bacterium]
MKFTGYAGQENPVGKRFKGLIRWAVPVIRDGRRIGYLTLALDHTHLIAFTDHLIPTEERYTAIPNAQSGNYAFMADYEGKIIAHPRQYHIMGYDPATGEEVPPWLDTETYAKWKKSGKRFSDFVKVLPPYDKPSRYKTPSVEQIEAGQMGIDYRYLNFAPQCRGFQTITQHGGSGSFHLFWSGLWKLNATAAIPYYTGRYGFQARGFGHVGITANVQEFHKPALATKEYIDRFIAERDAELARDQQALRRTISDSVADSITKLSQSTGLMLAIVIGLAAWIASALRNRVATVTRGVREFQDGNLHHRLEVKSRDELSQLAKAFNQMAQSIEASYVKLGKSERRFRAIFNQTFQLTGFLSPDGMLLAANTAMLQFAGAMESELVGKPCWTLPWWADSPDLQRQVREAVEKAAEGEFLRFEASSPGRGGGTSFFDFSLKPFKDDGGYVVNLVLEARDITELKQAEHELRKHRDQLEFIVRERTHDLTLANEQLQREILERKQAEYKVRAERDRAQRYLDIAGAIIVMIDAQQKTALINKKGCEVLGYDEKELIGKNWFDTVLPRENRETHRMRFAALLANKNKSVEYVENTVLSKDGEPLTIAWQISVLTDMNGAPMGTLISGVDITQRKKAERELRRARDAAEVANRTKSTFLANISHEIRTPLNAILGFCQLLLRDSAITAKQRESLETINRSGEHLLALINEVLEMSKIESGCSSVKLVNFDLYRLLEDVEMMFRVRTETKGLQFEVSTSKDLPRYVVGDQGKIRQVLINLLGNAVKFTEHGGVILRVLSGNGDTASAKGNLDESPAHSPMKLVLEVEDTGVGISEPDIEKVFQPFEQLGSGENGEGGTGLGLAISREFVSIMGGTISVTSREGEGSAFRIAIPIDRGNEKTDNGGDRRRRVIALEPGQPQFRILVVDDIQTNRDILCSMLIA